MKLKHIFILTFLFVFSLTGIAQEKSVYNEDFSSENGWPSGNNDRRELEIKNGKYYFEHKKDDDFWSITTRDIDFDPSKDFEIETNLQKLSGNKPYAFGLLFGYLDDKNTYHFMIGLDGQYRVSEKRNGEYIQTKPWTTTTSLKKEYYDYNKLTIKKTGNTVSFYINDTFVTSTDYKPFFANKIGIMVYNEQKIAIDYLKVNSASGTIVTNTDSVLYADDFSSNSNNWYIGNTSDMSTDVNNGKYYFEHKRNSSGWSTTQLIEIDTSKEFEIDTKILKVSGVDNNGFGIVFGRKDSNNQYVYTISSNGMYSIDKYVDGKFTEIKKWTSSSYINQGNGAYNTFKVKKENGYLKFYINDQYLTLIPFSGFMGDRFGYVIYKNQKIAADDLEIKYINDVQPVVVKNNDDFVTTGEVVLEDYFTSNVNSWPIGNTDDKETTVNNNYYLFEHKKNTGGWAVNIPKTIDTSKDFEISTKINKVSGVDNYSYGLQWGKKDDSSFRFYITGNGYYKISRVVNNNEEVIKKFTTSSYIKQGNNTSNILTIKKIGGVNKFYINGSYITEIDFEPFYGNRIGYVVFNQQKIGVDYLTIKYLKSANDNDDVVITSNTLSVPLTENFSTNSNGWNLRENSDVKTRIDNGKLFVRNNNEKGGAFISKQIDIDTNKDFIIETEITRLTSSSNASIAFVFGRKNNTNEYDLFMSKDSYLFRKLENDESIKSIPWTTSSALKTEAYAANKIKIVKAGGLLRFYINDQYVNEAPFSPFFGNYLGFSVYDKQEISIDYLNISYPGNNDFNTPPEVVITEPIVERGFKIVKTKNILVKGKATDKDGIYEIKINGIDAIIKENGEFTADVPLKIGSNDLVVKATDLKKASSTKTFTIKRKSPDVDVDDDVVVDIDKDLTGFGEYYALLIGVSDYGDGAITSLDGLPTKDAQDLANVLISKYNFKKENVVILNNSPTENQIIKEFSKLKRKVTNKDNLLVFYAGHGIYDEKTQVGSWLPSDADMEYELNLISNSQVVDYLKGIESKHTLLISDACFSGSIFKTREFKAAPKSVQKKYELTSRKAITSGTLKTVPNKSVFLEYLLKRLSSNTSQYLSARQLFNTIEEPVMNNSPNTPQYGTIYGIGDEGGDFIFIKK